MILLFFGMQRFLCFFPSFSFPGSGWAKRMKSTYTHGAPQAWFGFDTMLGSFGLSGTSRSFSGRSSGVFDVTQAHLCRMHLLEELAVLVIFGPRITYIGRAQGQLHRHSHWRMGMDFLFR